MSRFINYRGVIIAPHPTNPHKRFAWRSLTGRILYAPTLRLAKISIDNDYRVQADILADARAV